MASRLELIGIPGLPEISAGDDLGALICAASHESAVALADHDVIVVSQKVVSKAEGRVRSLEAVRPGGRARELADELGKDARTVELVLAESRRIVRAEHGVLIVETHGGWICANAGIDASNVPGTDTVSLLPEDADASARRIRAAIDSACGSRPAIVVADSFGRPWRIGQADVAIGCAGLVALDDWRGRQDAYGRELAATAIAIADGLAAAADLARDQLSRTPVIVVRGADGWRTDEDGPGAAATLQRRAGEDLFR